MTFNRRVATLGMTAITAAGLSFVGARTFASLQGSGQTQSNQAQQSQQDQQSTTRPQGQGQSDVIRALRDAGEFNTFANALQTAELVPTLQGDGPYTIFAPTDDAFEQLPEGTLDQLLQEDNREQLRQILLYHVASGKLTARDLGQTDELDSVQGESLSLIQREGTLYLNDDIEVTQADIEAGNGVIHGINRVLIPTGGQQQGTGGTDTSPDGGM